MPTQNLNCGVSDSAHPHGVGIQMSRELYQEAIAVIQLKKTQIKSVRMKNHLKTKHFTLKSPYGNRPYFHFTRKRSELKYRIC